MQSNQATCDPIEETENDNDQEEQQPMTPDWWNDLYTDGTGSCFSDADPGL